MEKLPFRFCNFINICSLFDLIFFFSYLFVQISKFQIRKLDIKIAECIFLGTPSSKKGCKCYFPSEDVKKFISLDFSFENISFIVIFF